MFFFVRHVFSLFTMFFDYNVFLCLPCFFFVYHVFSLFTMAFLCLPCFFFVYHGLLTVLIRLHRALNISKFGKFANFANLSARENVMFYSVLDLIGFTVFSHSKNNPCCNRKNGRGRAYDHFFTTTPLLYP